MEITSIDAKTFAKMFLAGAKRLEANKDMINELNVFPVPDGDTGINMTMTIMSAAKEVAALEEPDMATLAKAISGGSLRGARGNSGVILSQLFRGFTKTVKKEDELNVPIICEAFQKSVETAYRAVMKPKEGTILTVARAAADKAMELLDTTDDIVTFTEEVVKEANEVLKRTPDMLPVLKQAGVVDAGGQGLVEVLSGGLDFLLGKDIDLTIDGVDTQKEASVEIKNLYELRLSLHKKSDFSNQDESDIRVYAESVSEELTLSSHDDILDISLFSDEPGRILTKAIKYGTVSDVSVVNRRLESEKVSIRPGHVAKEAAKQDASASEGPAEPTREIGFVAVSIGEGMNKIFKDLGADEVIAGGQTMNPSTEDILTAIQMVPAKNVFVLPNNKNIILAANQAKELCKDRNVIVIPTKTLPQGITAMINIAPERSVRENEEQLNEEIRNVSSGEITYAVRDTTIDDKDISEGDYMGIGDKGILSVSKDLDTVMISMLSQMMNNESSLISIYYGEEVKESDAVVIKGLIAKNFPNVEIELQNGGQPVYYYVVSVE